MAALTRYTRRDGGNFMGNYRIPSRRADFSSDARGRQREHLAIRVFG
jgi:hypothetical protein